MHLKRSIGLCIVIICSFFMVRPLLNGGYFPMHDDTQIARVVEMGKALRQGQFPVRWVSDLGYGYGYPIFNFYGPLPYYVGGFFYALGMSGLVATKLMMGLGLMLAGIVMYVCMADILGVSGGLFAAILYMYAPYHAVDAFVRGAVGEYWALMFLPLVLYGFWRKRILVGAVGIAGLIVSHTILGYAGMLFIAIAVLISRLRPLNIGIVLLGLGLSAFFWMPALTEMKYTNVVSQIGGAANYHDHFVCLPELWNSLWGYGGSAKGCLDGFSFKLGKIHILLALVAFIAAIIKKNTMTFVGIGITALSVFFMTSASTVIWDHVPYFAYIQYPWRFLAFSMFGLSIAAASAVRALPNMIVRWTVVAVFSIMIITTEGKHFEPQYLYGKALSEYESSDEIQYRASKISDEYLPKEVVRPTSLTQVVRDTIPSSDSYSVKIIQNTNTYKKFEFLSGNDNDVTVNVAYFPGWEYHINEFTVSPTIEKGLPVLRVPAGLSVVQMMFKNTPIRTVGNIVTIISAVIWVFIYDNKNKKTIG